MSLVFCDSFDHYASADILKKWDNLSGVSVSVSAGRCGTSGLLFNGSAAQGVKKAVTAADTYVVGFALNYFEGLPNENMPICAFGENAIKHVDVYLLTDGRLRAFRGPGSVILGTSTPFIDAMQFNYVEVKVKVHDSTGTVTIRVNGVEWLNLTGQDTQNGGVGEIAEIFVGGDLVSNVQSLNDSYVDDVYIVNTSGAVNNDFLGDVRVEALFPTGAGNYSAWTPSAGSNYQNVDENPPDADTTYNSTATATNKDSFAFGNLSVTSGTVNAVQINMVARKDDAGVRSLTGMARLSAVDAFGAAQTIGNTYVDYRTIMETDPSAGTWSIADVNAAEFGYRLES